jgi:hypothetical protein
MWQSGWITCSLAQTDNPPTREDDRKQSGDHHVTRALRPLKTIMVFLLLVGLAVPSAALAATKVKTKIVLTNVPEEGYYSQWWDYETTSVPSPVAKARLMYFSPTAKKWVGYPHRPIKVLRYRVYDNYVTVASPHTDKKGYFSFKLRHTSDYKAAYAGSAYSSKSSKRTSRTDWVSSESTTVATTTTVDATRTRINIESDFRYNPYVNAEAGVSVSVVSSSLLGAGLDWRTLYTGWVPDANAAHDGYGHASLSFVVPTQSFDQRYVFMMPAVSYWGDEDYLTEDDEGDPWFGVPVPTVALPE